MAMQNTQVVALQLEKVRKKVPKLYEVQDTLFSKIEARDVEKVSTRTMRIPLQTKPGGNFGYASFDGGDLGRGSGTVYDVAQITPQGLRFAVEVTKIVEYATNTTEKAVADATKREVANGMKQFRRDIDCQLQTAGNGVCGTVSSVSGNVITMSSTPFGARLLRPNQKAQVYSSDLSTNRGSMTLSDAQSALGATPTITVDVVPPGTVANDVIVPDGLAGASPVGLYGIPYHHSNAATGTWMGIARSNVFTQAVLVDAKNGGLAIPQVRAAVDSIMQNLGIEEEEAMNNLRWYGHRAQRAAYHEIAFSISMLSKSGGDQDVDLLFRSEKIGGIKPIWSIHADTTRLDLLNLDTWGRAEWKEIDYFEVGGDTVFPVYGNSGGLSASYLFYFVCGLQFFVDNPKAVSSIINLAVPSGY